MKKQALALPSPERWQTGWDAARKIRSMRRRDTGTIPIIAMSANAFEEDIINSRISGMDRHLTKPLEEKKLLAAFRECRCGVWKKKQIMTMWYMNLPVLIMGLA